MTPISPPEQPETPILSVLHAQVLRGRTIIEKEKFPRGEYQMWVAIIRHHLFRIYGTGAVQVDNLFPKVDLATMRELSDEKASALANITMARLSAFCLRLDVHGENIKGRVFIGHGRSPLWRELKDFLQDRLHLQWDEFNREAVAGLTTFERLDTMLSAARFAFLVMTAEEEHLDATLHARENVVHEVGLFQGHLGPRCAIVLLEEGCAEFSNIVGLSQIRFPKGHISACFEEIRRVLEREGVIIT